VSSTAERESEIPEAEEVVISVDLEFIDTDIKDEELRSAALDLKHYWYTQEKWVEIGYTDEIPVRFVYRKQIEYPQVPMAFTTVPARVVATKPLGVVRITPRTKLELVLKGAGEVKK